MQYTEKMLLSDGEEILCTAGECFLTRRKQEPHDHYVLATALIPSWSNSPNICWKPLGNGEQAYLERAGTEEQRQSLLAELAKDGTIVYNREWRSKILSEPNVFPVVEGEQYIVTREHFSAETEYSLTAPAHGTSCMADQFPWSIRITATQAKFFELHPDKMLEYYNQYQYKK